jgi:pre-mRNA cleavage complex 2 protein Pcf11
MSLYPQNHYGQPYAAHFNQPGIPYQYQQSLPPPPPPVYHMDPNTFRRDYSLRLAELTINSRPIIQNLSMLAQDFSRFAEIVAQCIEAHIRRVSLPNLQGRCSRTWNRSCCYRSVRRKRHVPSSSSLA